MWEAGSSAREVSFCHQGQISEHSLGRAENAGVAERAPLENGVRLVYSGHQIHGVLPQFAGTSVIKPTAEQGQSVLIQGSSSPAHRRARRPRVPVGSGMSSHSEFEISPFGDWPNPMCRRPSSSWGGNRCPG